METEFNWITRLNELVEKGDGYHPDDHLFLTARAREWPTCACGQLCRLLPKHDENGAPKDVTLYWLGVDFYNAIQAGNWSRALDTFYKIEERSTKLLKDMGILNEKNTQPVYSGSAPYCVDPGSVQVLPASSKTFATTASGSTDSRATQRLQSVHGIPAGN